MIRAALDANVLVSGILGALRETSTPGAILRAWRDRHFELITSDHIRAEVERALTQDPYFSARLTPEQVSADLASLAIDATQAEIIVEVVGVATHPEDDLVLAAAVSAGVDYLVTGGRQLLTLGQYRGITICSPRDFHSMLEQQADDEVDAPP